MSQFFRGITQRVISSLRTPHSSVQKCPLPSDIYNVKPEQSAQDLIHQVKPIEVEGRGVGCDGGNGPLGHPMVYINLDGNEPQACGYCGIRFVQKHHHHHHHGH
eukprot:gene3596-4478_t